MNGPPTDSGSRGSGPASADSSSATSSTVRAIGPSTGSGFHGSPGPASGITPGEGRRPTSPQNAAGLRTLAPRSDPSANGSIPDATAAAAPPLDPPGVRDRSHGLRVAPKTALKVCDPAPNSGVFVLPITIAPAARSRSTSSESAAGTWSANSGDP